MRAKKYYGHEYSFHIINRVILIMFIFVLSVLLPYLFARLNLFKIDNEEATVGIFGGVFSALAMALVAIELSESSKVSRCTHLAELNMNFIENLRLMYLYQELTNCAEDPNYKLDVVDGSNEDKVNPSDIMGYLTYYEVINEYLINGVMDIGQMDDLFGDRFFKLVHNDYVQRTELFSEPSSYVNIYHLYKTWIDFRNGKSEKTGMVVSPENVIPDYILDHEVYLKETRRLYHEREDVVLSRHGESKTFSLRRLYPKNCKACMNIQDKILKDFKDKSTPEVDQTLYYEKSREDELYESMLIDYCYGLFDGDKLAGYCICVLNRDGVFWYTDENDKEKETTRKQSKRKEKKEKQLQRNLSIALYPDKFKDIYKDYITFDTIQVDPDYRGYGIHQFFIDEAEAVCRECEAKYIIATVHPKNVHSTHSFEVKGFDLWKNADGKTEFEKYGSVRNIFIKEVN